MGKSTIIALIICTLIFSWGCGKNPIGSDTEELLPRSQVEPLENQMFNLINGDRTDNGLYELTFNEELRDVAVAHSEDMYIRDFFDHINPDGDSPGDRCDQAGIDYIAVGENIAMNSGYDAPVDTAEAQLMRSTGHRANILSSVFTEVGVGIATDGDEFFFTQVFMEPNTRTFHFVSLTLPDVEKDTWPDPFVSFEKAWQKWQLDY